MLTQGNCWRVNEKQGILCDLLGEHIRLSLVDPKLEVRAKKKSGKLAVVDKARTILDRLLKRLWFGFLDWLLQIMDSSSIFIYGLSSQCVRRKRGKETRKKRYRYL